MPDLTRASFSSTTDRPRLLTLVPEWSQEQLFDPVPGTLRVVYRVEATP